MANSKEVYIYFLLLRVHCLAPACVSSVGSFLSLVQHMHQYTIFYTLGDVNTISSSSHRTEDRVGTEEKQYCCNMTQTTSDQTLNWIFF